LPRESNQREGTLGAAVAGLLPGDCARGLRDSLTAHPCADSELARILRATLWAFSFAPSPRHRGARVEQSAAVLAAEAKQDQKRAAFPLSRLRERVG